MMGTYETRKERDRCPYVEWMQNPRAMEGTGPYVCNHPSPNIGSDKISKAVGKKYCIHGDFISGTAGEKTKSCRILSRILKEGEEQTLLETFL